MIDRRLNYGRNVIKQFLLDIPYAQNILDIGAGPGSDLDMARLVHKEAKLFAVDCMETNFSALSQKGIRTISLNIERDALPFDEKSLDVIIANQILEHTKDIFFILHELTRTLRHSGHLIVGVPNLASLHNRIRLMVGLQPTCIRSTSAHVRGFTRSDLENLFHTVFPFGFEVLGFKGANFYPFPPIFANQLAAFFPSLSVGIFFLLRRTDIPYENEFVRFPIESNLATNFWVGGRVHA